MAVPDRALLVICVNDTPENNRFPCTDACLTSLEQTVEVVNGRHEVVIVDNGSTDPRTDALLQRSPWRALALRRQQNRYATNAFNTVLRHHRQDLPQRVFVRIENDIVWRTPNWPDLLIESMRTAETCGLKPGLISTLPTNLINEKGWDRSIHLQRPDGFETTVLTAIEVPGFCTAFHPDALKRLGYLQSAGRYIEDVITSDRVRAAGFNLMYVASDVIVCEHVDDKVSRPEYSAWKQRVAFEVEWETMQRLRRGYKSGQVNPYVEFN